MSIKETNNMLNFYPRATAKELVVQKMEDELLVYNLQTNQAMCLNQTAGLVWENCDGKSSASEIAQRLSKKFKGGVVDEELVMFAVMELREKGLLENGEQMPSKFEGLSRREIVRKVGFASLVALPVISSIIAPKAAVAQSCVPEGRNLSFAVPGRFTNQICETNPGVDCDCSAPTRRSNVDGSIVNVGILAPCCAGLTPVTVGCRVRAGVNNCSCECQR